MRLFTYVCCFDFPFYLKRDSSVRQRSITIVGLVVLLGVLVVLGILLAIVVLERPPPPDEHDTLPQDDKKDVGSTEQCR